MRRLLVLLVIAASFSCGKNPAQPNANPIKVTGQGYNTPTEFVFAVDLSQGGSPLKGVVVRVNGTLVPEQATPPGRYRVQLPVVAPGTQVKFEITSGGDKITGVTTFPRVPVIVAPAGGAAVHPGTPLTFSWTDSESPEEFWAYLAYYLDTVNAGPGQQTNLPGSARTGTVNTTPVPATATHLVAWLYAVHLPTFTGPADAASRVEVYVWPDGVSLVLGS
jgi:hypothetical protein